MTYSLFIRIPYEEIEEETDSEVKIPRYKRILSEKGKKFSSSIIDAYRNDVISDSDAREILKAKDNAFDDLIVAL
ncbi:MAG: hypothetical protein ACW99A_23395 [Candidatus Kariarchaeaceae archaeon]|jgi:hypothetical protein